MCRGVLPGAENELVGDGGCVLGHLREEYPGGLRVGMLVGGWKGGSVEVHKLEGDVVLKLYVI